MNPDFSFGLRFMQDAQQRFVRAGLAVYLRVKNFDAANVAGARLGFAWTPTGSNVGTTDILIDPPPEEFDVKSEDDGLPLENEYKIKKKFVISHTWVLARAAQMNYTDPYQVFRSNNVVGLVYSNRLYAIDSLLADDSSGSTIRWYVIANAVEGGVTT
jgi:hypothetical protein